MAGPGSTMGLGAYAEVARYAAIADVDALLSALGAVSSDPEAIAAWLRHAHLGDFVLTALLVHARDDPLTDPLAQALDRKRTRPRIGGAAHLRAFAEARQAFHEAGIPVLLIKGAVLASRLYGGIDHRPQHDIDLLVPRDEARRAGHVLQSLGYQRGARDAHAVSFMRDGVRVDLHHHLRSAPAYAIDDRAAWAGACEVAIESTNVPTLSDEHTLTLLATSLIEDVAFGMGKLRQVCDVWLFARALDADIDWNAWFAHRRAEGLEAVVANAFQLAGLAIDELPPRLAGAVSARRDVVRVRDRAHALSLLTRDPGSAANMAWFGEIYPGSLAWFRAHAFIAGFPKTWRDRRKGWLRHQLTLHRARTRTKP